MKRQEVDINIIISVDDNRKTLAEVKQSDLRKLNTKLSVPQQASLNGEVLEGPWITHSDVINGGELKLEMGIKPNKEWGSGFDWSRLISENTYK